MRLQYHAYNQHVLLQKKICGFTQKHAQISMGWNKNPFLIHLKSLVHIKGKYPMTKRRIKVCMPKVLKICISYVKLLVRNKLLWPRKKVSGTLNLTGFFQEHNFVINSVYFKLDLFFSCCELGWSYFIVSSLSFVKLFSIYTIHGIIYLVAFHLAISCVDTSTTSFYPLRLLSSCGCSLVLKFGWLSIFKIS